MAIVLKWNVVKVLKEKSQMVNNVCETFLKVPKLKKAAKKNACAEIPHCHSVSCVIYSQNECPPFVCANPSANIFSSTPEYTYTYSFGKKSKTAHSSVETRAFQGAAKNARDLKRA